MTTTADAIIDPGAAGADVPTIHRGADFALCTFPDYVAYLAAQEAAVRSRPFGQLVKRQHVFALAAHVNATLGGADFGICHGVRRGKELSWFRWRLQGTAAMAGTDLAAEADAGGGILRHDFHDPVPEWDAKADFVYSNAWNHAYDPHLAFRAWIATLRPGGLLLLDHVRLHKPKHAEPSRPFGATPQGLARIVSEAAGSAGAVTGWIERGDDPDYPARVLVFRKAD